MCQLRPRWLCLSRWTLNEENAGLELWTVGRIRRGSALAFSYSWQFSSRSPSHFLPVHIFSDVSVLLRLKYSRFPTMPAPAFFTHSVFSPCSGLRLRALLSRYLTVPVIGLGLLLTRWVSPQWRECPIDLSRPLVFTSNSRPSISLPPRTPTLTPDKLGLSYLDSTV